MFVCVFVFAVKLPLEQRAKMVDVAKRMIRQRAITPNVFIIRVYPFSMKVSNIGHAARNVQQILRHL